MIFYVFTGGEQPGRENPPEKQEKGSCGGKSRQLELPGKRAGKIIPPEKAKKEAAGENPSNWSSPEREQGR